MVPRPRLRMDVLFFVVMCLLVSTSSQQCSQLQDNDPLIGNYTSEDRNGLIYTAFESQGFTNPTVMVFQAKVVCLSAGDVRDTFTSVSIVANYSCTSASFPECDTAWSLSQFEFVCIPSANNSFQWGIVYSDGIITTPPNAGLSTDLRTDCSLCTSNTTAVNIMSYPDINHCIACPDACTAGRCTSSVCCNFYDNDTCVESCTLPARPNNETNCEVFCDPLPGINNGFLAAVSDGNNVGSVASYGCDPGYNLVGVANRTCTLSNATTFWSDTEPTCEFFCGSQPDGGLSPGAIAAIVIGIIFLIENAIIIIFTAIIATILVRNRKSASVTTELQPVKK